MTGLRAQIGILFSRGGDKRPRIKLNEFSIPDVPMLPEKCAVLRYCHTGCFAQVITSRIDCGPVTGVTAPFS